MKIHLRYGDEPMRAELDWARVIREITVARAPSVSDPVGAVLRAIENPVGQDGPLRTRAKSGEKVLILVSDQFRQTRADQVLPVVLAQLAAAGVAGEDVSVLFANGTHRPPTPAEQERILGPEVHGRLGGRIHVHDAFNADGLAFAGETSRGTRVHINRLAVECDRLIATGAVVLHYFGGYGGGRKSIVPGIAGADTIAHNHAMNLHPFEDSLNPSVRIGVLDGNPVAEDMLEAARLVKVDCIVNTVLDREGQLAAVFAGDMDSAHRAAANLARKLFAAPIGEQADLAIASAGNAKNFVQSHKALYNAWQAMKPGGRIVLLARCEEGLGGEQFVKWLRLGTRKAVFEGLRRQSEINGQTALSSLEKCPSVILVSELGVEDVALLGARRAQSLEEALQLARIELGDRPDLSCYLMPDASYTVPFLL